MYQDLSLTFYTSPDPAFEIYTQYMYEKIFGEAFCRRIYGDKMDRMRQGFFDDYHGKEYCLIRLTEAQNPFFRPHRRRSRRCTAASRRRRWS